jgi:hypothetical protein
MEKKKKIPREREREMPTNSVTSLVIFTLYMNRRAVKKRKSKRNKRISLPSRFTVVINVAGFYSFSVLVSSWFPQNVKSLIVNLAAIFVDEIFSLLNEINRFNRNYSAVTVKCGVLLHVGILFCLRTFCPSPTSVYLPTYNASGCM